MKKQNGLLAATLLGFTVFSAQAQFGAPGGAGQAAGPSLSGPIAKLFGDNTAFTASMEMQTKEGKSAETVTMPGKLSFLEGKVRFEMDMSQVKGAKMTATMGEQLKSLGMSELIAISRPDKKTSYIVYPGLKSYAEQPMGLQEAAVAQAKYKVETTELGKETVTGLACIKNKVVLTGDDGNKHEFTVCNAGDLKKFPVKIDMIQGGQAATMTFTEVKFDKPEAGVFDPPQDFTRYESVQAMMMKEMMKMMGK